MWVFFVVQVIDDCSYCRFKYSTALAVVSLLIALTMQLGIDYEFCMLASVYFAKVALDVVALPDTNVIWSPTA